MNDRLFRLGLATLMAHELDAVMHAEWRVLPLTAWLPEAVAYPVFVLAHIPLLAWILGVLGPGDATRRRRLQRWIAGFLVLHVGLHLLFSGHVHYGFDSLLSQGLIFGAGALGLAFLLLDRRQQRQVRT